MPKVSVIVPIYGVEKYIERCARSLFQQTLEDIEFIFVNDFTYDNSIKILENVLCEYPSRKQQTIILHHNRNLGLPQSRKTGIDHSSGEYIIHCDSDDWVDTDLYETMYNVAKKGNYDLVQCDVLKSDGINYFKVPVNLTDSKEKYLNDIYSIKSIWPVWNKLVRRKFYTDPHLVIPQYNMGEDLAYSYQIMMNVKTISFISQKYYYYFDNTLSISKNKSIDNIIKCFVHAHKNMQIVIETAKKFNINEEKLLLLMNKQRNIMIPAIHNKSTFNQWLYLYNNFNIKLLINPQVPLKEKYRFLKTLFVNIKYWF